MNARNASIHIEFRFAGFGRLGVRADPPSALSRELFFRVNNQVLEENGPI